MITDPRYAVCMAQHSPGGLSAEREPIASICLSELESLAKEVEELAGRVDTRLAPITFNEVAIADGKENVPVEPYPQLFDQLRTSTYHIRVSVNRIHEIMDRVEL